AFLGEVALVVVDVSDAARHAGGEVLAGGAENDDAAAGHVLAAVVADREHDRIDAAVAHAEALARQAANVRLAARGAVKGNVADNHVFHRAVGGLFGRVDDDLAARQTLADVIVGVAFEHHRHAVRHKRREALAGGALEVELDGVIGQTGGAVAARQLAADDRADHAVDVANR